MQKIEAVIQPSKLDAVKDALVEIVGADEMLDKAILAITGAARTGTIGDGKIFISKIDEAIRIRNDERGEIAL